ncbi:MAG: SRPBCC family protein [Chitinophaga sp.]|uniref:SRPBCC family protein n=1 Tax=Chitinophaga sp. TaxID=1869181 RepID=UPI001B20F6D0|nr:SRPBCC family protein [Chitinophaga sp.]MBO9732491.1 SRPBCC family protein [Chitinophaga sp.]
MAKQTPEVTAQMRIRKPVSIVFDAFIDPEKTKHFWFTKGSDKLAAGKTVTWEWEMYQVSTPAVVKEIIPNKKIAVDWGEPATAVDFEFEDLGDGTTYVSISNYGFTEKGDDLIRKINDSTGGFTTVVDGLKAYLEHNINLGLVADKFPKR